MPGIYFVLYEDSVIYIGRAKNIRKRWASHHRLKQLKQNYATCQIHWLVCSDISILHQIEQALIYYWKPKLNESLVPDVLEPNIYPHCLIPENNDFKRLEKGRITQDWDEPKRGRCLGVTDTAWKGLQLLADHHGDRSRAEYLERLVREECERLGIEIEPSTKPETLAA